MTALASTDYYEASRGHILPVGIVSDPPDYAKCVARMQAVVPGRPAPGELLTKCRELNVAVRLDAVQHLIEPEWLNAVARELGVTVHGGEVQQAFAHTRAQQYPTEADLRQYLTSRRLSLADLLLVARLNVLGTRITKKLAAEGKQGDAGFAKAEREVTASTSCSRGYVVQDCSGFKGGEVFPGSLSPAILFEQLTALLTGSCYDLQACGNQ